VEYKAVGSNVISKPLPQILEEVKRGLEEGFHKFIIAADNPGAWNHAGASLPLLLRTVLGVSQEVEISMVDGLHPHYIINDLAEYADVLRTGRIKSIMAPLQSGSNRILTLMNRRHTKESFLRAFTTLREAHADLFLITQIIVGFPSETYGEFAESVDVVIESGFNNVTMFPFYSNPLTEAHNLPGKISDEEKFRRVATGLKRIGRAGIFSLALDCEIVPQKQKVKAMYDE
jgi:tRNA A37 methylthiotransferase MiaB